MIFHPTEGALRAPFYFAVLKHHPHLRNSEVAEVATEVALRFPRKNNILCFCSLIICMADFTHPI